MEKTSQRKSKCCKAPLIEKPKGWFCSLCREMANPKVYDAMIPKIFVLAGSYAQFKSWQRENKASSFDRSIRYIDCPDAIRGVQAPAKLVKYGTWYDRGDAQEIENEFARLESQ